MKILVIYKEQSDHARPVIEFLHDFQRQTGRELETVNPESPSGIMLCETYDIMEYPTVLAMDDNGSMQHLWNGLPLPQISEVTYYDNH